jgi:hypothetical protein
MKSITSWFVRKYSLIGTLGLALAAIGMQKAYAAGVPSPIKDDFGNHGSLRRFHVCDCA